MQALGRGDIVRHQSGNSYIVVDNSGGLILAIREIHIGNPTEWTAIFKNEVNTSAKKKRFATDHGHP